MLDKLGILGTIKLIAMRQSFGHSIALELVA